MAVLTGQLGSSSSYLGNMILGAEGCTTDFLDGQLGTVDDYCGNMILAVANPCQPATQVTCPLCQAASNALVLSQTLARNIVAKGSLTNSLVFVTTARLNRVRS